jgi:hypothetical protein
MYARIVCSTLIVIASATACWGELQRIPDSGNISGQILDESRLPVAGVLVQVDHAGDAQGSLMKQVYTDQRGDFSIGALVFGKYFVYYQKPSDNYPRNDFSFYSGGKNIFVELTEGHSRAVLSITLGPKGGRLLGHIFDQANNAPIRGARLLLRRSDNPSLWVSEGVSSGFSLLVPSGVPFTITVNSESYESVPYGAPPGSTTPATIRVDAEGTFTITVKMRRIKPVRTSNPRSF